MEGGGETGDEDGSNCTGAEGWVGLQVNSAVGFLIWERELGGGRGRAKSTRGIPSSGSQADLGDDGIV